MRVLLWLATLMTAFGSATAFAGNGACTPINNPTVKNADMQTVRSTWLAWVNDLRATNNLTQLTIDDDLNKTAGNWSLYGSKRGMMDHKRALKAAYYDYKAIEKWFAHWGLMFKNVHSTTFTENIGWGVYRCSAKDCTKPLIAAIRSTFDGYLAERGKKNDAHYRSMTNPNYRVTGLGIAVDAAKGKYYLTAHYATEVKTAQPLCTQ